MNELKPTNAKTVEEYLERLTADRRIALEQVRQVIKKNLPAGYEEGMDYGMVVYYIPLQRYPKTYNGHPLGYVALASQKNYMSIYLMNIYGDSKNEKWFKEEFEKAGKKLDMGKSCVRFKKVEDLSIETIGKAVSLTTLEQYIAHYEQSRKK